jgi:hypothetical protein
LIKGDNEMETTIKFITIFLFLTSCKTEKDRTKWDPTPVLNSVEVTNTQYDPKNLIEYTTLGEDDSNLKISGKDLADEFGSISSNGEIDCKHKIKLIKISCGVILNSYSEMNIGMRSWGFNGSGAGTYQIRVKRDYSDWSNAVEVEVY